MNKIIVMGYLGDRKCYLNIEKEEAISRYCKSEKMTLEEFNEDTGLKLEIIEFKEEFGCYHIWEDEK